MHDCWKFKCLNLEYVGREVSNHQLSIQELSSHICLRICAKPWFFPVLEHGEGRLRCDTRIPRGIGINPIAHGPFDLAAPKFPLRILHHIFMDTVILPVCFSILGTGHKLPIFKLFMDQLQPSWSNLSQLLECHNRDQLPAHLHLLVLPWNKNGGWSRPWFCFRNMPESHLFAQVFTTSEVPVWNIGRK